MSASRRWPSISETKIRTGNSPSDRISSQRRSVKDSFRKNKKIKTGKTIKSERSPEASSLLNSIGSSGSIVRPPPPPCSKATNQTAAKGLEGDQIEAKQGTPVVSINDWQKTPRPILRPVLKAVRSDMTRVYRGVSSGIRSLGQYEAVRVTGTIACIAIATCVGAVIGINCITCAGGVAVAALVGGLATAALMQVGFVVYLGVKAAAKYFKDKNWNRAVGPVVVG